MNVGDILRRYLKENGYDGFYHPNNGCCCWGIDDDDELMVRCQAWHTVSPLSCLPGYHCKYQDGDVWIEPDKPKEAR